MKDWRNPNEYLFCEKLGRAGWAWQFLRRNPRYRQDWAEARRASAGKHRAEQDPDCEPVVAGAGGVDSLRRWRIFGGYLNPDLEDPPPGLPIFDFGPRGSMIEGEGPEWLNGGRLMEVCIPEGHVAYVFDLRSELSPQVRKAHEDLLHWQAYSEKCKGLKVVKRKRHSRLWCFYLRLLDADHQGATPGEIAKAFAWDPVRPREVMEAELIGDRIEAARRMTWPDGYAAIV